MDEFTFDAFKHLIAPTMDGRKLRSFKELLAKSALDCAGLEKEMMSVGVETIDSDESLSTVKARLEEIVARRHEKPVEQVRAEAEKQEAPKNGNGLRNVGDDEIDALIREAEKQEEGGEGIYEVYLEPGHCPRKAIRIPALTGVEKSGPKKGMPRKFNLDVTEYKHVVPVVCNQCNNSWLPEQPLRPVGMWEEDYAKIHPVEKTWIARYNASFICKRCKEAGRIGRGLPKQVAPGQLAQAVPVRPRYYLTAGEVKEIRRIASITEATGHRIEKETAPDGSVREVARYSEFPIVHKWVERSKDPTNHDRTVETRHEAVMNAMIRVRKVADGTAMMSEGDIAERSRLQRHLANVQVQIAALLESMTPGMSAKESELIRARLNKLTAHQKTLLAKLNGEASVVA